MQNAYVVIGRLTDERTVTLDEALPLSAMKVRLVVEPLSLPVGRPYQQIIAEIRKDQQLRGHQPPTREQADAYLQVERDNWGPSGHCPIETLQP